MVNPDIPGFYFDEVKKKYFRIVNGDQRINLSYHNNTVQALSREKKYHDGHRNASTKRSKTAHKLDDLIRTARMHSLENELFLKILQARLGLLPSSYISQLRIEHALECNDSCLVADKQVFRGLNDHTVFVFDGNVVDLMEIHEFVKRDLRPLGRQSVSSGLPLQNIVSSKDLVFIQNDSLYSLLHWQLVNGSYTISDFTEQLHRAVSQVLTTHDIQLMSSFVAQIYKGKLYMVLQEGILIVFDHLSPPFTTTIPYDNFENLKTYGAVSINEEFAFFNASKDLFAYHIRNKFYRWRSLQVIYAFFTEPFTVKIPHEGDEHFVRLHVVTRLKILTLVFSHKLKKFTNASPDILLHNDNNARPLIQMVQKLLIVQESSKALRIINTQTNTTRLLSLQAPLTSRGEMPRLIHNKNVLLLCHSDKTYQLSN